MNRWVATTKKFSGFLPAEFDQVITEAESELFAKQTRRIVIRIEQFATIQLLGKKRSEAMLQQEVQAKNHPETIWRCR
ncbi:MAG: hypothetical protein QGG09_10810 [Pirellulaceae bacterium]|nr:hypothetical protein [Pirellulaceae bacterium]